MSTTSLLSRRRGTAIALFALAPFVLAACAEQPDPAGGAGPAETEQAAEPAEVAAVSPRLLLSYDGGIQVLDATTLETVGDLPADGFLRLNTAGNGRHALVSTGGGFQLLDAGAWAEPHGDHSHYYTAAPELTDITYAAEAPGHVISHDGQVSLFDDGTGAVTVLDAAQIAAGPEGSVLREYVTPAPHHGVAIALEDDSLVVTEGTEEERSSLLVLDAEGAEIAASDDCPGVHGAEVAADGAVVAGCEDGALVYRDGQITHADSPDDYGRIGNQAAAPNSPIVLGDYKSDPDAELERPTQVSLIDTRTAEVSLVELPASYSFRSLARGDDGEALVLGTDGAIHVIDPEAGELERSIPVIEAWEEPGEWQQPRPTIAVGGGTAYVSDPNAQAIYAVDLESGEVWNSAQLPVAGNELALISGDAEAAEHGDGGDAGHEHEDHEHEHGDGGDAGHEHEDEHEHEDHEHGDHEHEHEDHGHDD
ncbi:zinc metallochaperone AztD [Ruania zhangjianzhongii]|uniref:zinc metallochaperone AztD n=1 Tax=Ruania zhangjianzhongii TaxID=2603206 RepID=UPI0011C9D2CB|nr:zinc metallochaperone AztD [Ruania zhangjianzhongii]